MAEREITLSVVSHQQNALVNPLLRDLQQHCAGRISLVLTQNTPDPVALATGGLSCPVEIVANESIKGFGANHNAAFAKCRTPYFCVCNPDIRLHADPFGPLIESLADARAAVAGPLVRNPEGAVEDSARRFPTVAGLLKKLFTKTSGPDYPTDRGALEVDWIAGMFMLFRAEAYRAANGFDEAYFLYYEDVDLCARLRKVGLRTIYDPRAETVHEARRASRRDLRHGIRHLSSALLFLSRHTRT